MQRVLSVSVAAYNVEAFIEKCLDSFLVPGVRERVEVLVTDDGSKDRTAAIVSEYQKKYPGTIRLIQQKNAGPGSTVNSGIAHAEGKYFRMVDGDDWVNTEDMGAFLDALEQSNADMVCANYRKVDHETGQMEWVSANVTPCWEQPFETVCPELQLSMHNVTWKTSILKEHPIHLDNCFYTDSEYLLFPIPYVKTVTVLNLTVYMYRVSLSTQSMNITSLQRNRDMHRMVLSHLADAYAAYEKAEGFEKNTGEFMRRCIAGMAGMQLLIYLSMEDTARYKAAAREMVQEIREKSSALYHTVHQAKTFALLRRSGFLLFPVLSAWQRKKLGLSSGREG